MNKKGKFKKRIFDSLSVWVIDRLPDPCPIHIRGCDSKEGRVYEIGEVKGIIKALQSAIDHVEANKE